MAIRWTPGDTRDAPPPPEQQIVQEMPPQGQVVIKTYRGQLENGYALLCSRC